MKIKCLLLAIFIMSAVLPSCKKDVPNGGGHAYYNHDANV